jgi:hypothetical protein
MTASDEISAPAQDTRPPAKRPIPHPAAHTSGNGAAIAAHTSEPGSLAELQAEFPAWLIDRGVSGYYYARRPKDSAVLSGEDLLDLRDQIRGWIGRHDPPAESAAGRVQTIACSWCQAPAGTACDPERDTDHLMRYARARHTGLISAGEHADATPASSDDGSPMVTAARQSR